MIDVTYCKKKRKGCISGDYFNEIREHFSVENPAARFNKGFRFVQKRLYSITPSGQFDIGLLHEMQKFVLSKQYDTKFVVSDDAKSALFPSYDSVVDDCLSIKLRDYQKSSVEKCLKNGRGVSVLGTGAGKTLIISSLIENILRQSNNPNVFKCLVLVPDLGLVDQTFGDFKEYNVTFKYTKWTGSHIPDLDANVVIANAAILQTQFDKMDWIKYVDVVIIDECHKISSKNKITKLIRQINTNNKYGFTGTLPESNIDKWNIFGNIGPILMEKSSHSLREESYLTNVAVKIFKIGYNTSPVQSSNSGLYNEKYVNELNFIYANEFRNKVITTVCGNFVNNSLILVNHLEHGQRLFDILSKQLSNRKIFFIRGEVEVDSRNEIKKLIEETNDIICIAMSSIFSTGVNIKNVHMILFGSAGKSFIRTVQSIGRGLRLHKDKEKLVIIDMSDDLEYGRKHIIKRKEIYNREKISYTEHSINEK